VGVGVGRSVMLHDPQAPLAYAMPAVPAYGTGQPGNPVAP
jgi:hypothetical protein